MHLVLLLMLNLHKIYIYPCDQSGGGTRMCAVWWTRATPASSMLYCRQGRTYWVPQRLPQICTGIAYICIGKVAWFAVTYETLCTYYRRCSVNPHIWFLEWQGRKFPFFLLFPLPPYFFFLFILWILKFILSFPNIIWSLGRGGGTPPTHTQKYTSQYILRTILRFF